MGRNYALKPNIAATHGRLSELKLGPRKKLYLQGEDSLTLRESIMKSWRRDGHIPMKGK